MACNENVIKNMANEITRNCLGHNHTVDPEFVVYLIELLLLNPKYGKLFAKTLNRNNLEYFVNECVAMLLRSETPMNTLKMQHIMRSNYDELDQLVAKHLQSISDCLKPLVDEILEEDPDTSNEAECKKLMRKISIYIILASGLGNPGVIVTLKEGMAALESVFSLEDLAVFVTLPWSDKEAQLQELMCIVSGVRLFNRDCKKGGENLPDLPFDLVDAAKACLASLSNSLITVMQRVNSLTSATEDAVVIEEETDNVAVNVPKDSDLTLKDYHHIFSLLAFNRQYEVYIRKLLSDVEGMVQNGVLYVDQFRSVLDELHAATKYKAAVPVVTVFPLFTKLWRVWRAMQSEMYLVASVNRLAASLCTLQEQVRIPYNVVERMLTDRQVVSDKERMNVRVSLAERLSLGSMKNYAAWDDGSPLGKQKKGIQHMKHLQYLGFCAMCLCAGALSPANLKLGSIRSNAHHYGFCCVNMAAKFSKNPQRYINEALNYARNNPHLINLLDIAEDVAAVKDEDCLIEIHVPKIQNLDKEIQTDVHPIQSHIEKDYVWNLWEWKRRACQWSNIVNCKTHSTQTKYSHLRSEIHCQTVHPRDKCMQTKRDVGVNADKPQRYLWGIHAKIGYGQHWMDLGESVEAGQRKNAQIFKSCVWPCVRSGESETQSSIGDEISNASGPNETEEPETKA